MYTVHHHPQFQQIDRQRWQHLSQNDFPFLNYGYLSALEQSGAVSRSSGWQPHHLSLHDGEQVVAVIPCYQKHHSRGEYVFDWSWADACHSTGLAYYPKLLCAIPFTPCPGPRWIAAPECDDESIFAAINRESERLGLLSWHLLFPQPAPAPRPTTAAQLLQRNDCQFHWRNRNYAHFDDFLTALTASKRKSIRKERRKVESQGVELRRTAGENITPTQLRSFYQWYSFTYQRRRQEPYLNAEFFALLVRNMPEQLLLVEALQGEHCCGAALFLYDRHTLYGRWWGGDPGIDCLHFEVCYYQGIEFAIAQGLQRFDPGTQGEHKLIRGFEPVLTRSYHRLHHPALQAALQRWTEEERAQVARYREGARQLLPYRRQTGR